MCMETIDKLAYVQHYSTTEQPAIQTEQDMAYMCMEV
jgi:hypothetical protein